VNRLLNGLENAANRRSFLKKGMAAGATTMAGALLSSRLRAAAIRFNQRMWCAFRPWLSITSMVCVCACCSVGLLPTQPLIAQPSNAAPSARTLYISNGGGNLATFAINPGGDLTLLNVFGNVGNTLRGIAIAPDGRTAYVADSDASTVSAFTIDEEGLLTPVGHPVETDPSASGPFPECGPGARPGPCPFGVAVAPNGKSVYVANAGSSTVSVFRVHPNGALSLLGSPVPVGGSLPRGIAASPDGQRLYVADGDNDSIQVFAIGQSGMLRPLGAPVVLPGCITSPGNPPVPACSPFWLSIAPNGRWLYASGFVSGDLFTFAIDADGGLTAVGPRVPAGGRPESIPFTPDGRFLYASSIDANAVFAFSVGVNGQLTSLGSFPVCQEAQTPAACGAVSAVISPDGGSLYVATTFKAPNENDVLSFRILADGTLAQLGAIPTGGDRPLFGALAIRPNQGPTAAFANTGGVVNEAIAFDASKSFDPDGRIARYHWDFGDGHTAPDGGPSPTHVYAQPDQYRVTVTVTDNEGCSGALIFTGQTALCNGSPVATTSRLVNVRSRGQ
jgi:DNA-binding beta-propeller fold protein YncE